MSKCCFQTITDYDLKSSIQAQIGVMNEFLPGYSKCILIGLRCRFFRARRVPQEFCKRTAQLELKKNKVNTTVDDRKDRLETGPGSGHHDS